MFERFNKAKEPISSVKRRPSTGRVLIAHLGKALKRYKVAILIASRLNLAHI